MPRAAALDSESPGRKCGNGDTSMRVPYRNRARAVPPGGRVRRCSAGSRLFARGGGASAQCERQVQMQRRTEARLRREQPSMRVVNSFARLWLFNKNIAGEERHRPIGANGFAVLDLPDAPKFAHGEAVIHSYLERMETGCPCSMKLDGGFRVGMPLIRGLSIVTMCACSGARLESLDAALVQDAHVTSDGRGLWPASRRSWLSFLYSVRRTSSINSRMRGASWHGSAQLGAGS